VKGRDLLILLAVVLVGGFAVADALRRGAADEPAAERGTTTDRVVTTSVVEPPDEDLGRARFPQVNGAGGALVLTQAGSCAVREIDLPTGIELPNVVARSTCELWAAPVTAKVAVGIGEPVGDAVPFRFIDLQRANRDLGTSEASFGFLVWSPDGQRAAWCNRRGVGIDLELGRGRRLLPECPAAYTPEYEVAFARGADLVVGDRIVLTASGGITNVHYATDSGSVAVVVEGRRIERYVDGRLTDALDLEERFQGRLPTLSPDNCSAAFRFGDRIRILNVGCSRLGPSGSLFPGHVAAWSPDGNWLVVGGATELTFYDLVGGAEPVTWPVGVVEIEWRRG
jgi:WD40-like Beta Propeller Repeat